MGTAAGILAKVAARERERERERIQKKTSKCEHHTKTGIARNWLTLKFVIMSGKAVAVTSNQSLGFRIGGMEFRAEDLGFRVRHGFHPQSWRIILKRN